MTTKNRVLTLFLLLAAFALGSCKKTDYSFGELVTPSNLVLDAAIEGVDAANPNGNGTGKVLITVTATNAISYQIDFGDNTGKKLVPSGTITYRYGNPGTTDYTITVTAIGTGGAISTISKTVKVFVDFVIPDGISQTLTNGSSRIFVTDHDAPGHFGVGPSTEFSPIWYSAAPNSREACAYDDEITFSKDVLGRISMTIDNKGTSFSIGAASSFYGFSGGDGCYPVNTGGTRLLTFMNATSGSNSSNSTQIQFTVPGNGIINFGTGGITYEILSYTGTTVSLRNIGIDGNSWYQKLIVKP